MNAPAAAQRKPRSVPQRQAAARLLAAGDPSPITVEQARGESDIVFVCDHAGRLVPRALGTLGLSKAELASPSACDIGVSGMARQLSEQLDAILVMQNYSRLVIDCNRVPKARDSIPTRCGSVKIAGNEKLAPAGAAQRQKEIFAPYHDGLRTILDHRQRDNRRTLLVTLHSYVPSHPWQLGVMYRHDTRIAAVLLELLRQEDGLEIGDNQPYSFSEENDYTLPIHGEVRGIAHVGLEVRQDLIANATGQGVWAGRLADVLVKMSKAVGDV